MFSSFRELDWTSIDFYRVNMLPIVSSCLLVLPVISKQLGLVRAELYLVLPADVVGQLKEEVQAEEVVGG